MDIYEVSALRELNERLAKVNNFDLDALMLNRDGVLAPSQKKILYKRMVSLGGVLFFFVAVGIYQYYQKGLPSDRFIIWVYGAVLLWISYALLRVIINATTKRVESLEGVGFSVYEKSHDEDYSEILSYYYQIGTSRFEVKSEKAYSALVNELRYRAYYLPKSNVLVNIEALEAPPSNSPPRGENLSPPLA